MNTPGAMVGMTGGAVGAPMGSPAHAAVAQHEQLNTYIYDHLCKLKLYELARQFVAVCPIKVDAKTKKEMNGDSDMDMDTKDEKRPDDLPVPNIGPHFSENSFLFDWWCQFWDIYGSLRHKGNNALNTQYLQHNMTQNKMRNINQQNLVGAGANMMGRPQQFPGVQPNGINMQKQAMANRGGMQQMMASKMQQNNMQDGDRPQSPNSMGNAPSPSKRPRIDESNFNGQPGQAGRGQPMNGAQMANMPGGPNGMIMPNGMPADMAQMNFGQNGQPKMDMGAGGMGGGGMGGGAGGPQGMEGSFDMITQQQTMANGAANPSQGNHALQDYQMQLMLLEQQNKKRLLMARQEQDNVNHVPGSSQPGQIQFANAAAMSPSNGRSGPSPNPNDQMKRMATPKMGQGNMPGSPAMPGDGNRGSPMPGGFDQNQVPPNMRQAMFAQQNMMAQGQPPSSHPGFNGMQMPNMPQMEQMRMAAQQGRMTNGQWQQGGQPMMQTPSQQGQQMGTPQQRTNMPPPPAPNTEQQRTQPSSPAQVQGGPPTPSQAPKAAPKGKKEAANKKNAPQKGNAKKDAATPAANDAAPPTPTASTPIASMNTGAFPKNPGNAAAPVQAAPPQAAPPAPVMDSGPAPFGDLSGNTGDFNLDFSTDGPDVLENFDFDSFLHNTDDTGSFGNFDFMTLGGDLTETSASS